MLLLFISLAASCTTDTAGNMGGKKIADSIDIKAVYKYIAEGDAIYAQKSGYRSFSNSLVYYDSAQVIADKTGDTLLIAEATFAKGRIYDAWNRDPQKTIFYFTRASALFASIPGKYVRHMYVKHLVAHAYDKIHDSAHAVTVLNECYTRLRQSDTAQLKQMPFITEMALISTEVNNYQLADSILLNLTRRQWISNDTDTYDYLNHYYLTRSRIDVYYLHKAHSFYLDSLQQVYRLTYKLLDRIYYSKNLSMLFAAQKDYANSYKYYGIMDDLSDTLNKGSDIITIQNALFRSEEQEHKRTETLEAAIRANRINAIWLLSVLLVIITILSFYLYRQGRKFRAQSVRLVIVNNELDNKIAQVEVLNKEIQHRVKNNLQMIYSLLQMQERKSENEETIDNLRTAQLRVESIASLHNRLLIDNGNPDFAVYLKDLIATVINCLPNDKKVVTHISADDIHIPVNNYFALSLILNEWVTNSVKYAICKDDLLQITISIKNIDNQVCVDYRDSGTINNSVNNAPGLGTQIINLLANQMSAELTRLNSNLYHYRLCIPHGT